VAILSTKIPILLGHDFLCFHVEGATLQRLGVEYFPYNLSDRQEVTDEQMEQILATIRRAPKPLLIHCKAGADRTGLVAALYHYGIEGQSAAVADGD